MDENGEREDVIDSAEIARLREEQAGDELVPIEDVWRDLEAEPGHEQSAQLEP